jgi:hypothetical protein
MDQPVDGIYIPKDAEDLYYESDEFLNEYANHMDQPVELVEGSPEWINYQVMMWDCGNPYSATPEVNQAIMKELGLTEEDCMPEEYYDAKRWEDHAWQNLYKECLDAAFDRIIFEEHKQALNERAMIEDGLAQQAQWQLDWDNYVGVNVLPASPYDSDEDVVYCNDYELWSEEQWYAWEESQILKHQGKILVQEKLDLLKFKLAMQEEFNLIHTAPIFSTMYLAYCKQQEELHAYLISDEELEAFKDEDGFWTC